LTGANTPAKSFDFNERWSGVAVENSSSSAAGSIYVADQGHGVVDRFKLVGGSFKYESQLTGGSTPFVRPEGVATDALGDLYVSDPGAEVVREYSPAAVEIASFPVKGLERSVSVDSKGDIFLYGNPDGGDPDGIWAYPRPTEVRRAGDTSTSPETVVEVPEVEGAIADNIDRATNRGYVAIHGRVIEGIVSPLPQRTGVEFGSGTFSEEIESIAVNEETGRIYVGDEGRKRVFVYQGAPAHFSLTLSSRVRAKSPRRPPG
jgi:hypothetical protein